MTSLGSVWSRAREYIRALGAIGQLMTVLGLMPTLVEIFAPLAGRDVSIPAWASALWLIVAFGVANFRVFEAYRSSHLELVLRTQEAHLGEWLSQAKDQLHVQSQIEVSVRLTLDIINHSQRPTHVKFAVLSVESEWIPAVDLADVQVDVRRPVAGAQPRTGNPFTLDAGEIDDNVWIKVDIPFTVAEPGAGFAYLGSLARLRFCLGAEQAGRKTIDLWIDCDAMDIHRSIENALVTRLQHARLDGNLPRLFLEALRQYWGVER